MVTGPRFFGDDLRNREPWRALFAVAKRRGRRRRDFAVSCEPVEKVVYALIHSGGAAKPHSETNNMASQPQRMSSFREVSN